MNSPYRRRRQDSKDLESRVSSVETAVEHIEVGMGDIKDSIRTGFSEIKREIDDQQQNSRPQVVAWAGWAAVLLLVIGMFGSGYVRDLNRVEEDLTHVTQEVHQHLQEDAAVEATTQERLNSIERKVFIKEVIVKEVKPDG
jgi:hypothetical protein